MHEKTWNSIQSEIMKGKIRLDKNVESWLN